jgi:hypothetical protein
VEVMENIRNAHKSTDRNIPNRVPQ